MCRLILEWFLELDVEAPASLFSLLLAMEASSCFVKVFGLEAFFGDRLNFVAPRAFKECSSGRQVKANAPVLHRFSGRGVCGLAIEGKSESQPAFPLSLSSLGRILKLPCMKSRICLLVMLMLSWIKALATACVSPLFMKTLAWIDEDER